MNDLLREFAPISDAAWKEIDEEARSTLKLTLAGRRLVDFVGPLGWSASSVPLGRVSALADTPRTGVEANARTVKPLIELRVPFELSRRELEAVARGGKGPDLKPLTEAAREIAMSEDGAIFHGYDAGGIEGIGALSEHPALRLTDEYERYPEVVADALSKLRSAGVAGPYAIALGSRCYTGLTETTVGGFPVYDHVERLLDGGVFWAPGVDGAFVISTRGGDFELTVGQDFSIGYLEHSASSIHLYVQESLTFRVHAPEAAVQLAYDTKPGSKRKS